MLEIIKRRYLKRASATEAVESCLITLASNQWLQKLVFTASLLDLQH